MPAMSSVIYVDTLILLTALSFLVDYLLLWATAKVTKSPLRPSKLATGASLGTAYFVLYYLSERGVMPHYGWLRFWPVVLSVSAGMLLIAFAPMPPRKFVRVLGYFYFITVSSGGAGIAAGYALGWDVVWQLLIAIAAILVTAEFGWGVVQQALWQRIYQVPLEVSVFGERFSTTALVDTGNRLKDPIKGSPVIVVEHRVVRHLFPEHLEEVIGRMERGDYSEVSRLLTSSRWSSRFRVIPFTSLGKESGMLIGFRPDELAVFVEGQRVPVEGAVIGIHHGNLDPDRMYHALIHPEILHPVQEVIAGGRMERKTMVRNA